jgi:hypothetical protein
MASVDDSILNTTKKILGIQESYTAFDLDISTHINSTLSVLYQMGIGPAGGFHIEGADEKWSDLALPQSWLNLARTYLFLKVKMIFDPPSTSFHIEAMNKQILEHEVRLMNAREEMIPGPPQQTTPEEEPVWG